MGDTYRFGEGEPPDWRAMSGRLPEPYSAAVVRVASCTIHQVFYDGYDYCAMDLLEVTHVVRDGRPRRFFLFLQ